MRRVLRWYDQLKADPEKRIPCYVDYDGFSRKDGGPACRDICTVKGNRMEFTARGIGYGGAESWLDDEDKKEAFLKDCVRLNVEWLDAQPVEQKENDAVKFADWIDENAYSKVNGLWRSDSYPAGEAQLLTTEQLFNEYQKQNKR
jgi:hypothetical protein